MKSERKPAFTAADDLKRFLPIVAVVAQDLYGIDFRKNIARCPFLQNHSHGDRDPSLRYDQKKNRLFCASQNCFGEKGADAIGLVQCMDGCSFPEAIRKLTEHYGIQSSSYKRDSPQAVAPRSDLGRGSCQQDRSVPATSVRQALLRKGYHAVAQFDYGANLRKVRFEHHSARQADKARAAKDFRWEHLADGEWYSGDGGLPKPLYVNRLFRERDQVGLAVGFEGEAKADLAGELGFPAFSFKDLTSDQAATLTDCDVVLWPDNDASGKRQADACAGIIGDSAKARSIKLLTPPPEFPPAADIIDVINDLKWGRERVVRFVETATPCANRANYPGRNIKKKIESVYLLEHAGQVVVTGWPDLILLTGAKPELIPATCIPGWLGEMAQAVADSTETPLDLPALLAIAVVSSCVAAKADISPEEGYTEPLNIFVCPAMESGNRKTAVSNRLIAPLAEWERIEVERIEPERKRRLSERRTMEARIERLRKKAASADDPRALMKEIQQLENDLPEVPVVPRIFCDDITPERVASLMQEQGGRLAVFSDEGGVFDILAGRYSKGVPNLDLWLKGHSVSPVRVDRQDRSRPPIIIDRPHLTVGISPQPDVLASLRDKPGFRGRGLLARFLYALPQSRLGYRALTPKPIPGHVENRYRHGIQQLIEYHPDSVVHLQFDPAAYREWKDFQRALEPQFRDGGVLQSLRDWGGKLAGAAARLAAIYHIVLQPDRNGMQTKIARSTVMLAIELATCLISHAQAVFTLMDRDPAINDAEKILAWIVRQRSLFFTVRDCFRSHQGRFQRVDAMLTILVLLEQHGYIRRVRQDSGGGRPASDLCEVNPALFHRGDDGLAE